MWSRSSVILWRAPGHLPAGVRRCPRWLEVQHAVSSIRGRRAVGDGYWFSRTAICPCGLSPSQAQMQAGVRQRYHPVDPAARLSSRSDSASSFAAFGRGISGPSQIAQLFAAIAPQWAGRATLWSSGAACFIAARRCQVQRFNPEGCAVAARGFG